MTLAEIRHSLALSKAQVSREAGVSVYTLTKLEQGRLNVPAHKLAMIMNTYTRTHGADLSQLKL